MKRRIAIVLIVLALAVLGYWVGSGANIFTKTQVQVPVEDDLFGTTTMEWKNEFHLGLEYAGPIAGALILAALVLLWMDRKRRKSLAA